MAPSTRGSRTPRATICSRIILSLRLRGSSGCILFRALRALPALDNHQFETAYFVASQLWQRHDAGTLLWQARQRDVATGDPVAAEGYFGDARGEPELDRWILKPRARLVVHLHHQHVRIRRRAFDTPLEAVVLSVTPCCHPE